MQTSTIVMLNFGGVASSGPYRLSRNYFQRHFLESAGWGLASILCHQSSHRLPVDLISGPGPEPGIKNMDCLEFIQLKTCYQTDLPLLSNKAYQNWNACYRSVLWTFLDRAKSE